MDSKRNYFKFLGIFLGVMLIVGGGYWLWNGYWSSAAKARRFAENQVEQYQKAEKAYIEAMTADTYGGKTPKETLDLFVAALKKGDIDLASKYFLLDENLSREKWVMRLNDIKNKNLLEQMIKDLGRSVSNTKETTQLGDFEFVIYKNDGSIGAHIDMQLNEYTKVWKIESL